MKIAVPRAAIACLLLLLATWAPATNADIYKRVDGRGVTHYSDDPKGAGWVRILKSPRKAKPAARRAGGSNAANRKRYGPIVERVAAKHRIDAALVHAVVMTESAYNPRAVSPKGATGLMQLMGPTAKRYGVEDRFNPEQNVDGGVRYLVDLLKMFDDVKLALAAYNAGEGAVERYNRTIPPFRETQAYVKKVLAHYRELTRGRKRS